MHIYTHTHTYICMDSKYKSTVCGKYKSTVCVAWGRIGVTGIR